MPFDTEQPSRGGIIIPTSDPNHGSKVMAVLDRLAEGATPLPKRGADKRAAVAGFLGETFAAFVEAKHPKAYAEDR